MVVGFVAFDLACGCVFVVPCLQLCVCCCEFVVAVCLYFCVRDFVSVIVFVVVCVVVIVFVSCVSALWLCGVYCVFVVMLCGCVLCVEVR